VLGVHSKRSPARGSPNRPVLMRLPPFGAFGASHSVSGVEWWPCGEMGGTSPNQRSSGVERTIGSDGRGIASKRGAGRRSGRRRAPVCVARSPSCAGGRGRDRPERARRCCGPQIFMKRMERRQLNQEILGWRHSSCTNNGRRAVTVRDYRRSSRRKSRVEMSPNGGSSTNPNAGVHLAGKQGNPQAMGAELSVLNDRCTHPAAMRAVPGGRRCAIGGIADSPLLPSHSAVRRTRVSVTANVALSIHYVKL
jgi:hypothetical protein